MGTGECWFTVACSEDVCFFQKSPLCFSPTQRGKIPYIFLSYKLDCLNISEALKEKYKSVVYFEGTLCPSISLLENGRDIMPTPQ